MFRSKVFQVWLGFFAMLVVLFGFAAIFSYSSRPLLGPLFLVSCGWCPLIGFAYAVWTSVWGVGDDFVS